MYKYPVSNAPTWGIHDLPSYIIDLPDHTSLSPFRLQAGIATDEIVWPKTARSHELFVYPFPYSRYFLFPPRMVFETFCGVSTCLQ